MKPVMHRLGPTAAALLVSLGLSTAWAAPHGTVLMRDGRRFDDVEYEVRGTRVRVKTKYGAATFDLADVLRLIPMAPSSDAPSVEEEEEEEEERGIDWPTRFRLEAPDGWELTDPSGPLVRAALRHQEQDALLEVTVRPAVGTWDLADPRGRLAREVTDGISAEQATFYQRAGRGRFGVADYQHDRVVRIDGLTVTEYGAGRAQRSVSELRFHRFGLEYALTLSLSKETAQSLPAEAQEAAFAAFSFLPPLERTDHTYSDFDRGFMLRVPGEGWQLIDRPFEERRPLLARTRDGRAEVSVVVLEGSDPRQAVEKDIAERRRRSRYLEGERIERSELDGADVVKFMFEDFRPGGRKKLRYQGFAARLRGSILLVTGIAPLSDEDARKLQGEVESILASVRLQDLEHLSARMRRQKDALAYVSAGANAMSGRKNDEAVQKLDRAIELYPNYALAYYLRAQAKKNLRQFDASREDLTRAGELAPGRGYDAELIATVAEEAAVEQRQRNFRQAAELWIRAYRSSKSARHLTELCRSLEGYGREAKGEAQYERARELQTLAKPVETVPKVAETLAKLYGHAVNELARANQFLKAKRILGLLRRLGRVNRSEPLEKAYEQVKERLKQAEDRAKGR